MTPQLVVILLAFLLLTQTGSTCADVVTKGQYQLNSLAAEYSRTDPSKVISAFSQLSAEQWFEVDLKTLVMVSYSAATLANLSLTQQINSHIEKRLTNKEASVLWGKANFNLGFALFKSGNYHQALDAYTTALSLFQSINEPIQVARVKGTIALLQSEVGDPNSALNLFSEVITVYREQEDWHKLTAASHNKAVALIKLEKYEQAQETLMFARDLAIKYNRPHVLVYILKNQGKASFGQGDLSVAKESLRKALELAQQQSLPHLINQILVELIEIALTEKDFFQAETYLIQAFDIARNNAFNTLLIKIYAQRATLSEIKGNYQQAFQDLSQSNQLRAETANSPLVNKLQGLNTYFVTLRNEHEKALLENQNTIMSLQIENARKEKLVLVILFLLGLVVAIVIALFLRLAVNKARRFEEQSRRDTLTKLPNRTAFHDIASQCINDGRKPCCFALADIDNFKKINDTYGHDCGDVILKWVAQQLTVIAQKRFTVARWGGEEFVFVIPNTPLEEARELLDQARDTLAKGKIDYYDKVLNISMTFGVTQIQDSQSIPKVLTVADKYMYQGKSSGKNCVVAGFE